MRHRENCIVKTVSNRILILCEGLKTEPNYFNAFKKIKGLSSVTIYPTKINTAKELLKLAKNLQDQAKNDRSPFEEIWLVFDKDGYTKHPEVFDSVRSLQNDVIKIAFSSPCFEFWYLLHFAETTAPFKDCDDVISRLKKYLPNYEKNKDYFSTLNKNLGTALINAKRVNNHQINTADCPIWEYNPYTNVFLLVEKLIHLKSN